MGASGAWTNFTNTNGDGVYLWGAQAEEASGRWVGRNELTRSNDMNNAAWTHSGSLDNMTVGTGTLPDSGPTTYWEMEDWGSGSASSAYYNNVVLPYAGRYIFSGYVRKGSGASTNFAALSVSNLGVTTATVTYDLTTGATNEIIGSPASYGSEDVGNGWWRIWVEYYANSDDLNGTHWVYQTATNSSLTYTRDGSKMDVAGFQSEPKKPNVTGPSVYVGTDGATDVSYSPATYIVTTTAAASDLVGANDGLVDWEERTNIGLYSEDISLWSISGATRASDQTISPDGSLTADELIEDSATARHEVFSGYAVSATDYCFSIFAKANTRNHIGLWSAGDGTTFATFNLSTGAVTNSAGGTNGIEDYGNGWYRCWAVFTVTAATHSFYVGLQDNDSATRADSYLGDGTSSAFIWGRQIEVGEEPSPYIRTTTGTATASADNIKTTDLSWVGTDEHTFYFHGQRRATMPAGGSYGFSLNDNSFTERFAMYGSANDFGALTVVATGTDWAPSITAFNNHTAAAIRCVLGVAANDGEIYTDGTQVATTSSLTVPSVGLATLDLGKRQDDGAHWNGLIKEFRYYDQRFSSDVTGEISNGNFPGGRRVQLERSLTADLTRGLTRNLIN
jgi:hypothetical protein